MKMNRKILISFLLVGLVLVIVGCAQAATLPDTQQGTPNASGKTPVVENPMTPVAETPTASEEESPKILKIADVLGKPEDYQGQAIVVEGKIVTECPSGCWFTLNDGTGTIYVDLLPSNLVIPQKRGAFATVYGKVVRKGSDTYLIGTKVEF
jgi:outer membrane protein assembly factor BamB